MGSKHSHTVKRTSALHYVLAVICGLCLVISLFAAGFAACAAQPTTRLFSSLFSDVETAPYEKAELVQLAVATRDYTVCDYGRASQGAESARESYCQVVIAAAEKACSLDSPTASEWDESARTIALNAHSYSSATACAYDLAEISEKYALGEDALDHLDDCYAIIGPVIPRLWGIAALAVITLIALLALGQRKLVGNVLFWSPIALLAFMVVCGIWAAIDFNAFFGVFHALLFPQGNWTFPYDSLLICMLPLNFWVSMGALWLAVTVLTCIIAMLIGKRLRKRA